VLSQCTIAAVSAASIVFNLPKRHPTNADQTLIAYDLLLVMTPALLVGVSLGVIFNVAFPTWLITTMLVSLLTFMSTRTAQKALQQWQGETQAQRQAAAAAAAEPSAAADDEAAPLQGSSTSTVGDSESGMGAVVVVADEPTAAEGSTGGKARRQPFPWGMAAGVVFLWCGFGTLQLLRQNTTRCSPAFYSVLAGQVRLRDPGCWGAGGGGGVPISTMPRRMPQPLQCQQILPHDMPSWFFAGGIRAFELASAFDAGQACLSSQLRCHKFVMAVSACACLCVTHWQLMLGRGNQ